MSHRALPRHDPFMAPEVLLVSGARVAVTFVDARSARAFEEGHLPGARYLPARELHEVVGGVRALTTAGALAARLQAAGIGVGPVVVYGGRGGADAAHVWWTLQAFGHPAALMLDGGIEGWLAAGGRLERSEAGPAGKGVGLRLDLRLDPASFITFEELRSRLGDPELAIVDTRTREEFTGEVAAARRGGHIPGASLFPWDEALDEGLRVAVHDRPLAALAPALRRPEVAVYCQSGVRAAHTYAVLTRLGHPRPRLYLGSWAEWGNREGAPVARDGRVEAPEEKEVAREAAG